MTKCIAIIPARYHSERLPGKALMKIGDKTLLERVCMQIRKCKEIDRIIIATDDKRIVEHAKKIGVEVEMTFRSHESGTDRCAQVGQKFWSSDIILNIQGDEPFINPDLVDKLALKMKNDDWLTIVSAKTLINDEAEIKDPNTVKVVCDKSGKALYFSRYSIPYIRDNEEKEPEFFKHLGIYGFRNKTLQEISALKKGKLEKAEKLEQLRWMENSYPIYLHQTDYHSLSVDTREDLEKARKFIDSNGS